jgi:hypothetical protein
MEYLEAWVTLIHEKNLKSKILCQTPFKRMLSMRLMSYAYDEHALNAFKHMLSILLMIFSACSAFA